MTRVSVLPRRPGRLALAALLLAGLLAIPLPAAVAQTFPALSGRVVDEADLLDPEAEAALTEKLAAHEKASSDQVVVATVPDLQGYAVEDFGVALGRTWKIGQKGENNGVILLVSKNDRKVRIEVGYGLEGTLTDALASVIIQTDMLPAFRNGDYPGGIDKGVDGILQVLSGDAAEFRARAGRNAEWEPTDTEAWIGVGLFLLVFLAIAAAVTAAAVRSARNLRQAMRYGTKTGPNSWLWNGVLYTLGSSAWSSGSGSGFGSGSSGGFSGGGGSFGGGGSSGSW